MTKAVLIDLDGTLVDTLPDIHAALGLMCARYGLASPDIEAVRGWIGKGSQKLVDAVLLDQNAPSSISPTEALDAYLSSYVDVNGRFSSVYPGVKEGLQSFHHHKIEVACVTNKPRHLALALLKTFGLWHQFRVLVGGGEGIALKPAPDLLLGALGKLHSSIGQAVMLGDSENDLAAARAAGCRCVLVDYGYSPRVPVQQLGADAIVKTLGAACDWMLATPH